MVYKIENEYLSVTASEKGGELQSVYDKKAKRELLWQGDPQFWADRAPNLFPYIARLTGGKYTYRGKEYSMRIHGIVMYSELKGTVSEEEMSFELTADEATKQAYPFDFIYRVRYTLKDKTLSVIYEVENRDEKEMFFGIGGHPGFQVPFVPGTKFEDYVLEFPHKSQSERIVFSKDCFVTGKKPFQEMEGDKLCCSHSLFDDDAIVLENAGDEVILRTDKAEDGIRIECGKMRYIGLWHCPRTEAPYICVEPWSSLPSRKGIVEDLEQQDNLLSLLPGEIYSDRISVTVLP